MGEREYRHNNGAAEMIETENSSGEMRKETIRLVGISENEDGSVNLEFDMSEGFREAFKNFYGLKRWSQKKFNEWVDENLSQFLRIEED